MTSEALDIVRSEALSVRAVRTAYGIWQELLVGMMRSARELENIGEHTQATALRKDAEHITRRCMRHLKRMQLSAANTNGGEP
jgi:hypothetical protein